MARGLDMALFKTAPGSLARRQIISGTRLKQCKIVNTSRMAFQSYYWLIRQVSYRSTKHWPSQCRISRFCGPMWHQYPIAWPSWKSISKYEFHGSLSQTGSRSPAEGYGFTDRLYYFQELPIRDIAAEALSTRKELPTAACT